METLRTPIGLIVDRSGIPASDEKTSKRHEEECLFLWRSRERVSGSDSSFAQEIDGKARALQSLWIGFLLHSLLGRRSSPVISMHASNGR